LNFFALANGSEPSLSLWLALRSSVLSSTSQIATMLPTCAAWSDSLSPFAAATDAGDVHPLVGRLAVGVVGEGPLGGDPEAHAGGGGVLDEVSAVTAFTHGRFSLLLAFSAGRAGVRV
jgi:hypothetical protein